LHTNRFLKYTNKQSIFLFQLHIFAMDDYQPIPPYPLYVQQLGSKSELGSFKIFLLKLERVGPTVVL